MRSRPCGPVPKFVASRRSEEHTSELQSQSNLVCRLLLENNIYFMGAASYQQTGVAPDAKLGKHSRHVEQPSFLRFCSIEFEAADYMDRFGATAQFTTPAI